MKRNETKQERRERAEEMINREYSDLSAETRRRMITAEWASIDAKFQAVTA